MCGCALIGDHKAFGPQLVERLERAVERTAGNDRLTLVVALNYGARGEIAAAARALGGRGRRRRAATRRRSTKRGSERS